MYDFQWHACLTAGLVILLIAVGLNCNVTVWDNVVYISTLTS